MPTKETQFAQLIWLIRRLFQRLAAESNDLLTEFDITAGQRAVLEFLDRNEPETLANMARANNVSRQHIQQLANDLLERNLVTTIENPSHKRSFFVQRTEEGRNLFNGIKETELELFGNIVKGFKSTEIEITLKTLNNFNSFLQSEEWLRIKLRHMK